MNFNSAGSSGPLTRPSPFAVHEALICVELASGISVRPMPSVAPAYSRNSPVQNGFCLPLTVMKEPLTAAFTQSAYRCSPLARNGNLRPVAVPSMFVVPPNGVVKLAQFRFLFLSVSRNELAATSSTEPDPRPVRKLNTVPPPKENGFCEIAYIVPRVGKSPAESIPISITVMSRITTLMPANIVHLATSSWPSTWTAGTSSWKVDEKNSGKANLLQSETSRPSAMPLALQKSVYCCALKSCGVSDVFRLRLLPASTLRSLMGVVPSPVLTSNCTGR